MNLCRGGVAAVVLYGFSGLAGVSYEVLWARMLTLQFGVSVFGVVVTVAAFMAGLGLGSLAMAWASQRIGRPLLWLALLEAGVAAFAWILPTAVPVMGSGFDAAATRMTPVAWQATMAGASFLLLTVPAFALGAGFPLLMRAIPKSQAALGLFYGVNTLGAVAGALLPLALLPSLGWTAALRATALLGLAVALGWALLLKWRVPEKAEGRELRPPGIWLITYGGLGAMSLVLEIAWTRLFSLVMLRTEYVLALILAAFLGGIGLGSLWVSRTHRPGWARALPWLASSGILLSLALLPLFSSWIERTSWASFASALWAQGGVLLLLTLPATLVLGAWLPILARQSRGSGVWLYGANALGGAVGAAAAGYFLIPLLGTPATLVLAAWGILGLGLFWNRPLSRWMIVPALAMAVASFRLASFPAAESLLPQALAGSKDLYRYEDAVAMTQVVELADGQRLLLTDLQRRDASTEATAVYVQANQARLALLLHPAPHKVLFLGLGTGISAMGSQPYPGLDRTAVELSRGAILAARQWFAPLNGSVLGQTEVLQDDARHFLSASRSRYDVIVGDLFHPDLAGVSSLLSVQQFRRVRSHLADGGIFVQWIALNQFDSESLVIVLRSFRDVFPQGQLFLDGMHLALVGPNGPWSGANAVSANLDRLSSLQRQQATAGEGEMTWLGRYWGPIPSSRGVEQDEWAPQIEFRLPRLRYGGGADLAGVLERLVAMRPDVDRARSMLGILPGQRESFERAYIGTELLVRSWISALNGQSGQAARLMGMAFEANPKDRWTAYALSDQMLAHLDGAVARGLDREQALRKLQQINPWSPEILRALWHEQKRRHEPAAEATRQQLLNLSPLDREALSAKN
ncbi:MAG: fused MFS/spermidine synthase [Betaproteobacteria bacterium]|nr:fused MFS/spermidine synthase [Betaproteobacteria bacterium]